LAAKAGAASLCLSGAGACLLALAGWAFLNAALSSQRYAAAQWHRMTVLLDWVYISVLLLFLGLLAGLVGLRSVTGKAGVALALAVLGWLAWRIRSAVL
jgi:hypothetical protein